jgi:hypothetical protein
VLSVFQGEQTEMRWELSLGKPKHVQRVRFSVRLGYSKKIVQRRRLFVLRGFEALNLIRISSVHKERPTGVFRIDRLKQETGKAINQALPSIELPAGDKGEAT